MDIVYREIWTTNLVKQRTTERNGPSEHGAGRCVRHGGDDCTTLLASSIGSKLHVTIYHKLIISQSHVIIY